MISAVGAPPFGWPPRISAEWSFAPAIVAVSAPVRQPGVEKALEHHWCGCGFGGLSVAMIEQMQQVLGQLGFSYANEPETLGVLIRFLHDRLG
jgi:hypothetical protein